MRIGGDRSSRNVEDRRGQTARRAGAGGGLGLVALRLLFSRGGRRLILPLLAVLAIAAVFLGPQRVLSFVAALLGGGGSLGPAPATIDPEVEQRYAEFSEDVLATTEEVWSQIFRDSGAGAYPEPTLVLYNGATNTACGYGQAAMGPFYCPPDQRLYIDLAFFEQMAERMNAGGDFAQAYVIAHEIGHHIQNLQGVLDWSQNEKQRFGNDSTNANRVQVRVELMADCYAGVWANRAGRLSDVDVERGDLEEALGAATAVGDDTLQRQSRGRVVPDAFTHGSAEQRVRWFRRGFDTGDVGGCNTRDISYERL